MIISRTPFRVSFFGGGTDYPRWYLQHGGQVPATTINKYCYITCRNRPPFMEHRIRLAYSRIENCQTLEEIAHPVIRAVLRYLELDQGLEIKTLGLADLGARMRRRVLADPMDVFGREVALAAGFRYITIGRGCRVAAPGPG